MLAIWIKVTNGHYLNQLLLQKNALVFIFSDVWTSPTFSIDNYKYYIIFVDHFTKYIWFYPLKKKFDGFDIFQRFRALVENFFN